MRSGWLRGAVLGATSLVAHAQTYDLDITMTGISASPVVFSGGFTFNPGGTGLCSTAFCGPGVTPSFTGVLISDPLGIDTGGPLAFTNAVGGSNTLSFFDTYWGSPGQSSFAYRLGFTLEGVLGGPAPDIGLTDVTFSTDGNFSGSYSCGGPGRLATPGVSCITATLTEDPSGDPGPGAGERSARGVPEPGPLSLLALGLAGLALVRPRGARPASMCR